MFDLVVHEPKRRARIALGFVWALAVILALIDFARADERLQVDALIITGIDISGSMEAEAVMIEVEGIAGAIQAPDVLAAIQAGDLGRIGFVVFLWADRPLPLVARWRVIENEDDAAIAAAEILAGAADAMGAELARGAWNTDLTGALLTAAELIAAAPFRTDRAIVNIVTDGAPTQRADDVPLARTALLATGATLNGMIVGGSADTVTYFRNSVVGGPSAFTITASKAESLVYAFRRKFRMDISGIM